MTKKTLSLQVYMNGNTVVGIHGEDADLSVWKQILANVNRLMSATTERDECCGCGCCKDNFNDDNACHVNDLDVDDWCECGDSTCRVLRINEENNKVILADETNNKIVEVSGYRPCEFLGEDYKPVEITLETQELIPIRALGDMYAAHDTGESVAELNKMLEGGKKLASLCDDLVEKLK